MKKSVIEKGKKFGGKDNDRSKRRYFYIPIFKLKVYFLGVPG